MDNRAQEPHVAPTEARAGVKIGRMRYVLGASLAAIVVGFVVAWLVA